MSRGQTIAAGFALLYLALLATVAVLFAYVGEQWWVSGVGLYLPRALLAVPLPATVIALVAAGLRRLIWTQALASALLVFPLMGFAVHFPLFRASALPALRVLSYNVNSTTGGVGAIVEEIDRHSPDVVLLQEVASTDALADLLRARYSTVEISGQFMFASRYPLLSTREPPRIPYEGRLRSPRFVQQVLDTPLGHIVFYNVHPLSPRETLYTLRGQGLRREILSGRLFSSASSDAFQANSRLRTLQVQAFSEAAGGETDPVVIAGDTNLPGLSFVFRRYLSDYQDGFTKAGFGFGYTFPADRRPWMRIDRILARGSLRFVGFEVGKSLASDHHCVVADLQRSAP